MTAQNVITGSARATKGASGTHPRDKHKIGAPVTETTYNDHRTQMGGTVGAKTNPFSSNATKEDLYIQWQPNVLTTLQSWTYHLRLTMMSPKDKTKAGQSGIQTLNSENGIVVAETGVTSKFNITQLETTHIVNWTPKGRAAYALTATMTITEPLGVSLLDYIVRGEKALGLKSRTETIYLLEISFPENDDKQENTNEKEYHFSYAMVITDFTVAVDQGGAKYYLKLVEMGQIALRSSVQDLHGSIKISANTLGQFTTEFSKILNEESKLETQHSAKFPDTFSIGFDKTDASEQMSQWVFGGLQVYSGAPKHKLSLEGDILTSEFHKGSSIIDILSVAIAATVEMQQLPTIDGGKAKETGEDKETKQDSPHAWFKIVPEVIITNNYDTKRKVYQKTFIYKIKLIMDERLATLSDAFFTDPEKQKQRVGQLGKFKLLTKKYMYMYTGQNTEVLHFDIKLNYIYWRMVATGGGMQSNPDTILSQDPSAEISGSSGSGGASKDFAGSSPEIAETSDGAKPAKSLTGTNGTGLNSSVMPPKFGEFLSVPQADEEPIKRTYLESFSAENDQEQENWYAPKIQATSLPTDTVAGTTQVAGATPLRFGEVYADKTSGDFMNIELNIVGDPYWLGMSNINKQYANIGTNLAAAYDHGSNLFYFKLLMPQEHDETGDTIITDSFTISGLYCVTHVISSYVDGGFTQHLQAYRSLASNYNLIKGQLDGGKNVIVVEKPDKQDNDATPSDQLNEDTKP